MEVKRDTVVFPLLEITAVFHFASTTATYYRKVQE